jgi:hypothetical protein
MRATRLAPSVAVLGTTALVGLGLAGCSSDTHAAAAKATATATAVQTAAAAPKGLAAKLLTAADLPSGWGLEAMATNPEMSTSCPVLNPSVWNAPLPDHAEVDLTAGMTGPFLVEQLAGGDSQQVAKAWSAFTAAIPKCTTYSHAGSSGSSTFTVTSADFPQFGSASHAFALTVGVTSGVGGTGNIVVARTSGAVVMLVLVGVGGVPKSLMEQIAEKAVAKVG